ncbi:MAG: anthranilate phosphoribosyltransferase [Candidatus Lokiarchaeota archaeon]|nr:anthranilate phosphoribosyltransferase [Candidatus Lokiarchaeota archaeon]
MRDGLNTLLSGSPLTKEQSASVMKDIMSGKANNFQIPAYLVALRLQGETPEIIAGAASVMREFASGIKPKVEGNLVDTCGTGGDKSYTFNISTVSALVVAGAGIPVAKHGNRSVSSKCGSADLLEGLGVNINLSPEEVEKVISKINIGFMFAPKFHPAMKYAMPARKGLGIRTIFNVLGPLTNPANAKSHVLGVFDKELVPLLAKAMKDLSAHHIYVVHSEPGIDEIVPLSKVHIGEVKEDVLKFYSLTPEDFGIEPFEMNDLTTKSLDENIRTTISILKNVEQGIKRKIVEINAAYAIMASDKTDNYDDALNLARNSIESGKALEKLKLLVKETNGSLDKLEALLKE